MIAKVVRLRTTIGKDDREDNALTSDDREG